MPRRRAEWTWTLPKQVDRPPRGAVAPTAYDTSNEPTELLGWGCEACEEEILGERFTCEECSYDVCEACHVANRVKGRRNKLHKHFLWRMGHVEEIRKAVTEGRAASGRKAAAKEVLSDSESESTKESSEESAEKEDEEEEKVAPEAMKEDTDEEAAEEAAAKEEEEEEKAKKGGSRAKPKPPAAKRQKKGVKEADGMRQPSIMEAMSTPAAEPAAEPAGTPEAPPVAAMPEAEPAEPAAEPEASPPTNAVVAPAATPQATLVTTPAEKPVPTPQATPVATFAETPQATPVATAQATPAATPIIKPAATPATPMPVTTPAAEPIAASQATPVTTPAAKPVATPQAMPVATFAETPQATPVTTPAATPQATPAAKPATPKPAKPAKPVSQADLAAMPKLLSFDDAGSGTVEGGEEHNVQKWLEAGFRTSHALLARLPVPHMEAWTETVDVYAGGNASTHLPVAVGAGEARAASGSQLVSLGWWADAVRRSRPLRDVQVCACGEDATPLLAVLSNAEAAFEGATAPPSHYVLFAVPGKPNRFAAVRPVPAYTLPEFNGAVLSVAFRPQSSPNDPVVVAFTAEVASDAATTTIGFFTLPTNLPAAPDAACGILAADVVAVSVRLAGRYTACAWIGGSLVVWDASGGRADARVLCGGPSHALRAAGTVGAVTAAAPLTAGRGALITVAPAQPAAGATLPSSRLALWRVKRGGAVAHQEWPAPAPALPQVSCVEWAAPCPPVVGTTAGEVAVFGGDGRVAVWLACSPCPVSLWPRAVRGLVPGGTGVAWLLDGGLALRTVLPGERSACEVCSRAGGSLKGPCACGREIAPVAWLVPKKEKGSLLLAVGAGVPGCFVEQGFGVCKECAEPVCGCAAGVGGGVAPELKDAVRWFAEEEDVDASCRSVLRGAAGKLVLANLSAGFVVLLEA